MKTTCDLVKLKIDDGWRNLVDGRSSDLWKGTLGKYAGRAKAKSVIDGIAMRRFFCEDSEFELDTNISRQVFPQAPSPTMTSLRRISAILMAKSVSFAAFRNRIQVKVSSDGVLTRAEMCRL